MLDASGLMILAVTASNRGARPRKWPCFGSPNANRASMKALRRALLAAVAVLALTGASAPKDDAVFVLGALHALHDKEAGFGYDRLRHLILAADPDVILLEVTPEELEGRLETKGRPEYPRAIWPLLAQSPAIQALAMEPAGTQYQQMVGAASAEMAAIKARDPAIATAWSRFNASLSTALQAHWTTPDTTHDAVTDDLARAWYAVARESLGPRRAKGQMEWDGFMIDRAREAVAAHPGKRVLVLGSYRNRHLFQEALSKQAPERMVDMEEWLKGVR